ncbi:hypothetical protein Tco_1455945 [Tanacetum coccineum]
MEYTCSGKEDSNSETASNKPVNESYLNFATKDVHAIKYKMLKAKERCMAYFRSLHSHLQVLSKEDLKGTRIENGFKWAFMSLFSQDVDTFTSTMLLNVDQLQKKLDKDEFQVDGSMAAFWVVNNQFQKFIDSQFSLDYDSQMIDKYFVKYTGIETKIDMGKAVDVDLVVTESSRTELEVQDESSRSGNDTYTDDAYIRPIYDEEPMAKVQLTAECNIFATGQQHTEQPEIINEGKVDQSSQNIDFLLIRLSDVYEKTYPRSDLRWKPTGRIFKTVSLRWVPMGKILTSYTSKDDSESTHGSNVDIPNIHESKQTLDLSAVQASLVNVKEVPTADMISMTSMIELESLFGHSFDEYLKGENQIVSKPSAVTTADASDKHQQQPDSTSSISTLATTVSTDGNFNL